MNASTKKLCIYGLATGLGIMIRERLGNEAEEFKDLSEIERQVILDNTAEIQAAGQYAIDHTILHDKVKVDRSRLRQVHRKVEEVCKDGEEYDVVETLSFLFLGLAELEFYCRDKKKIETVKDAALNFMTVYDPNLENEEIHKAANDKYNQWIEGK